MQRTPEILEANALDLKAGREAQLSAALLDRLAPSVLSIAEIHAMVDELIAAHGKALPFA